MPFTFNPLHSIVIYDEHLHRPVYFRQNGEWYAVEGSCDGCEGYCCIDAPYPEYKDSNGKCTKFINGKCELQYNKPIGCAFFPSGTPDQYFKELGEILSTKCKLRIILVGGIK